MEDTVPPAHKAAARAAVWDAFFRQELELLPATLPDALRAHSSSLLTDLTAQDLLILEDTLEFLADRSAAIHAEALPGGWDGECYTLTDDSHAAVQTLFNVSPTEHSFRQPASRNPAPAFRSGAGLRSGRNRSAGSAARLRLPPRSAAQHPAAGL